MSIQDLLKLHKQVRNRKGFFTPASYRKALKRIRRKIHIKLSSSGK